MRERVFAHRHKLSNLGRCIGQAEPVLQVAFVLAELLREAANAVAMLADHLVVYEGLIDRGEVLALEVFDDGDLECRLVVDILDEGWDRGQPGSLGSAPPALARDELVAAGQVRSDENRLKDAGR